MKIGRWIFNVYTVRNVSATKGEYRFFSVGDALDNPYGISNSFLQQTNLSAEKTEFVERFQFIAHLLGAMICDEVLHSDNDKPLTLKLCGANDAQSSLIVPTLQRGNAVWTLQRPLFAKITDHSRSARIPNRFHQANLSA